MTVSDSIPIQFWDIDDETFNEKDVCGLVKQDCFCQPWNCDDEIVLQFKSDKPIELEILSSTSGDYETVLDETFVSSLGSFSNQYGTGSSNWSWSGGHAYLNNTFGGTSDYLQRSTTITAGYSYRVTVYYSNINGQPITIRTYFGATLVNSKIITDVSGSRLSYSFEITAARDETSLSFTQYDVAGSSETSIQEVLFEENVGYGSLLEEVALTEVATGYWEASFTPSEMSSPAICNQKVSMEVKLAQIFSNSTFNHLDPWTNYNPGGLPGVDGMWSAVGGKASATFDAGGSRYLGYAFSFKSGVTYRITFDYTKSTGTNAITFLLSSNNFVATTLIGSINPIVNGSYSFTFTPGSDFTQIGFAASVPSGSGLRTVTVDNILSAETTLKKSDCLDIREDHACTKLITYTNSSDFDGIAYQTASPGVTFNIRVPAVFFNEDNPQTQEDLELSNGVIVTLRHSIVQKRQLELGYLPGYFHRKIQKILMHETIEIDGETWRRRDAYETSPVKKYNLKKASVWLTLYNSVEKNTL